MTLKNVVGVTGVMIAIAGGISVVRAEPQFPGRGAPDHRLPNSPLIVQQCRDRFGSRTCPPGPYLSIPVSASRKNESGGVRLLVEPATAAVYVNGAYVGHVSDFTKPSQRLELVPGTHRIEMRAPGYQPLDFEMRIYGGQTAPYRGVLRRE